MTIREKLSMFFNHLLDEIDKIDNKEIREYALNGLKQQVTHQMFVINKMLDQQENTNKGADNGKAKETV